MIVVQVRYTVEAEYVNANKEMIHNFLTDFKKLDSTQFVYAVHQSENDNTFVHISQYKNKDIQQVVLNTASFLHFQQERDKNLSSDPKIEVLRYIGASRELF